MKIKSFLTISSVIAFGAFSLWVLKQNPNFQSVVEQYIDNGEILTFEARFTPEKIMELRGKELVGSGERTFHKAELKFDPYIMFDVKYTSMDKMTKEGVLLWSLTDGEMVIDCENWDKTHGFEDAINAQANRNDFKILN